MSIEKLKAELEQQNEIIREVSWWFTIQADNEPANQEDERLRAEALPVKFEAITAAFKRAAEIRAEFRSSIAAKGK